MLATESGSRRPRTPPSEDDPGCRENICQRSRSSVSGGRSIVCGSGKRGENDEPFADSNLVVALGADDLAAIGGGSRKGASWPVDFV
jgi:hypothetical protein